MGLMAQKRHIRPRSTTPHHSIMHMYHAQCERECACVCANGWIHLYSSKLTGMSWVHTSGGPPETIYETNKWMNGDQLVHCSRKFMQMSNDFNFAKSTSSSTPTAIRRQQWRLQHHHPHSGTFRSNDFASEEAQLFILHNHCECEWFIAYLIRSQRGSGIIGKFMIPLRKLCLRMIKLNIHTLVAIAQHQSVDYEIFLDELSAEPVMRSRCADYSQPLHFICCPLPQHLRDREIWEMAHHRLGTQTFNQIECICDSIDSEIGKFGMTFIFRSFFFFFVLAVRVAPNHVLASFRVEKTRMVFGKCKTGEFH